MWIVSEKGSRVYVTDPSRGRHSYVMGA